MAININAVFFILNFIQSLGEVSLPHTQNSALTTQGFINLCTHLYYSYVLNSISIHLGESGP